MKQSIIEKKVRELINSGISLSNIYYELSKLTGLDIAKIEQVFNSVSDLYWKYSFYPGGKVNNSTVDYNKIIAVLLTGLINSSK